ncbi:uncharacterized protein LOC131852395 [Achroia grisella]|uniref:uncharacterized protein LOC131852395 n=1 Tax=Achroia grisella TaxID=688607 RepID=UPI0027D280B2|nr:uncharacterized protein LOC131852395 [Achroia grisella]
MSEQSNLDSTNLCISEELFDNFQSQAAHNEEEFITLSDILSPTTQNCDSISDQKETTSDTDERLSIKSTEVNNECMSAGKDVLSLEISNKHQIRDDNQIYNDTNEHIPPPDINNLSKSTTKYFEPLDSGHLDPDPGQSVISSNQSTPKKRGRKKKNTRNSKIVRNKRQNDATTQSMVCGNNTPDLVKKALTGAKRGRKKKNDCSSDSIKSSKSIYMQQSKVATRRSTKQTLSTLTADSQNPNLLEDIKPRKRGRPKKIINETKLNTNSENNVLSEIYNTDSDCPVTMQNKNVKRRRHSKSVVVNQAKDNVTSQNTAELVLLDHKVSNGENNPMAKMDDKLLPTVIDGIQVSLENNIIEYDDIKLSKSEQCIGAEITISQNDDSDDGDDISLIEIKNNLELKDGTNISLENFTASTMTAEIDIVSAKVNKLGETESTPTKRNSKMAIMSDFEYNIDSIDSIVNEVKTDELREDNKNKDTESSLLIEDTSKRPIRRKIKQNLHYDENSDEDPFANVELSDDEPRRNKKGGRYYSDDEYIPGGKCGKSNITDSTDSEEVDKEGFKKQKRKRCRKLDVYQSKSPKKRGKKSDTEKLSKVEVLTPDVTTVQPSSSSQDNDIEVCLESSVINTSEEITDKSSSPCELENFIVKKIQSTNLMIKKVSSTTSTQSSITPLEIPILDANDIRKTVEMSTQTHTVPKVTAAVQTTTPYDIPMKNNVILSKEKAEKACEFLNGIVKTTSELGLLMTQKSEDFMKKKINTNHVTDTFKMDYCVKKSFLLFKLAKHNLIQMEEDLAKQYEEFLEINNLLVHRGEVNTVTPNVKTDSDSDCEIIEEPIGTTNPEKSQTNKPKFNPKTVFLNKELSIKIAKKPTDEKKLNIKGKHTVWINDSVMVKKVKPNQSFLAQDSRNKKPPDNYISSKMISDFFKMYNQQNVASICAPFVSTDWLHTNRSYICNYFVVQSDEYPSSTNYTSNDARYINNPNDSAAISDMNKNLTEMKCLNNIIIKSTSPETLLSLCTVYIQHYFLSVCNKTNNTNIKPNDIKECTQPYSLLRLCINRLFMEASINHITNKLPGERSDIDIVSKELGNKPIDEQISNQLRESENILDIDKFHKPIEIQSQQQLKQTTVHVSNTDTFYTDKKQLGVLSVSKKHIKIKTLFSLCVHVLQNKWNLTDSCTGVCLLQPKSLKHIVYKNIIEMIYNKNPYIHESVIDYKVKSKEISLLGDKINTLSNICLEFLNTSFFNNNVNDALVQSMIINSVNTMSEEAFLNIEQSPSIHDNFEYYDQEDTNYCGDLEEYEQTSVAEENNWASQIKMKELRSFIDPLQPEHSNKTGHEDISNLPVMVRIKSEPEDEFTNVVVDTSMVKCEPNLNFIGINIETESVITKSELDCTSTTVPTFQRQNSSSYEFESLVTSNKMAMDLDVTSNEGIFSQSNLRVRRQFEPDSDLMENDMGLLIPHAFEPVKIDSVKDTLMESSSDESNTKKIQNKKKTEKRKKKSKKGELKTSNKETIDTVKNKSVVPINEVAVLTRKMKERIRQEQKKIESSESESENMSLASQREKISLEPINSAKHNISKPDEVASEKKSVNTQVLANENKYETDEIQCNSVDSTAKIGDDIDKPKTSGHDVNAEQQFPGFSTMDQNGMFNYQKYVSYVYDKIIAKESFEKENEIEQHLKSIPNSDVVTNKDDGGRQSPIINFEDPPELLVCQPTMPIFDDDNDEFNLQNHSAIKPSPKRYKAGVPQVEESNLYIERHGWKCYPVDVKDKKIYQNSRIILHKLPKSFVDTYFKYQGIYNKNKDDEEIEKLTNLQSLNRVSTLKDGKSKGGLKSKAILRAPTQNSASNSKRNSPVSDYYHELAPSEDEGEKDTRRCSPLPPNQTENNLAKNLLLNDNDTEVETEKKIEIKVEPDYDKPLIQRKPNFKSKSKPALVENPESVMLTADKMMNKELTILHAPIVLAGNDIPDTSINRPITRNTLKNSSKNQLTRDNIKQEEDSSSEEEKQWVTTKERLLKRLEKKQDTAIADDAKRTKIVNEFIERRGDGPEIRVKQQRRSRRSVKKRLERQKQLGILTKELLGENPDSVQPGKRHYQGYAKGRRNIRKVIDKKSLARGTVIANMEELERKRRLNTRQSRLRELLGCEEGVNVLVINGEVCLEYDFNENRPVVTIHPFFTKVMKTHQYEGVKFMWDACFESLSHIASGHLGGGCILAHCMGLGKTLQVLALLHTVLTHPGVGMQRVLVCCPLSTVLNWVDEIHKWIGPVTDQIKQRKLRRKLQVFELSKLKKTYERAYQLEDWYNGGGIFIIGYELFRNLSTLDPIIDDVRPTIINKIRTALLDPGPDIIVCDEGHLLKNDCSVLAVAMSRVVTKRRIILTGTPMQNNLREYYCMVDFVKPNLLGTYSEFSNRFENPIMNGQHRDSIEEDIKLMKARTHILHKVLEGCLQRQEASVLYPYLPKKYEYTVFISLTKCQWDLYKHYLANYAKESKQNILKDFHVLQKIWSHPQVLHNFQIRTRDTLAKKVKAEKLEDDLATEDLGASEDVKPSNTEVWWMEYLEGGAMLDSLDSSNKFVAVFRILDECIKLGDKVLIFSTSLYTMDALEFFLRKINKWSLGQDYYRLDGSVPAEVRQKWCREFNAEQNTKTKLFLISTRAGSLGLNMTAANRVIILDTSWNPAHDIQSIFRVYRFGQKKDCYIYRLVALGTMEQKIYERSVTKQAVSCRVVDEQQIDRHYNMEELTELYRCDEEGAGVLGGVAAGVRDVALLRVARLSALHAVHEHDSLLRASEPALPEHERAAAWMQFQQEHAGKQMQVLNITKRGPNKRPCGTESKAVDIKEEPIKDIKTDSDFKPSDNKQKKNKRNSIKSQTSPEASETPLSTTSQSALNLDKYKEEQIVKRISELLVKYDFQNNYGAQAVPLLVKGVRELVATGRTSSLPHNFANNELIGSIANVLLQKEDITLPGVIDIVCESVNNTWTPKDSQTCPVPEARPSPKPGPKCKKPGYILEETPSTSSASTSVEDTSDNTDGRKKRKAAVEAQKYIEKVTDNSIVDLGDDDISTDSVPDKVIQDLENRNVKKMKNKSKKNKKQSTNDKTSKEKALSVQPKGVTEIETSIILSDDDDEPLMAPKPVQEPPAAVTEVIPLHSSLLTNKNFIKIVAHTYLNGNPMLDDDAATLAAQYSTYKALKEIESTGRPLTSGPIYDIAVKVLGIDVLEKLHKTIKTQEEATAQKQNETILESEKLKNTPEPESKTMKKSSMPSGVPTTLPRLTPAPNVVPVGLFKRTVPTEDMRHEPQVECILPDDDDVCIVSDHVLPELLSTSVPPTSIPPASVPPVSVPPIILQPRRQAQPLILSKVRATKKSSNVHVEPTPLSVPDQSTPNTRNTHTIAPKTIINSNVSTISAVSASIDTSVYTPAVNPALVNPERSNTNIYTDTICLDSDEESPPMEPQVVKGPTPCALIRLASNMQHGAPIQAPSQVTPTAAPLPSGVITTLNPASIILTKRKSSNPTMFMQNTPEAGTNTVINVAGHESNSPRYIVFQTASKNQTPDIRSIRPISLDEVNNSKSQIVNTPPPTVNLSAATESILPNTATGAVPQLVSTNMIFKSTFNKDQRNTSIENTSRPSTSNTSNIRVSEDKLLHTKHMQSTVPQNELNKETPVQTLIETSSSTSSAASSRPSSPDDPLSILKDVVHIQAYDAPKPKRSHLNYDKLNKTPDPKSNILPNSNINKGALTIKIPTSSIKCSTKSLRKGKTISVQEVMSKVNTKESLPSQSNKPQVSKLHSMGSQSSLKQQANIPPTRLMIRTKYNDAGSIIIEKSKLLKDKSKNVGTENKFDLLKKSDVNSKQINMVDLTESITNSSPTSGSSLKGTTTKSTEVRKSITMYVAFYFIKFLHPLIILYTTFMYRPAKTQLTPSSSSSSKSLNTSKKRSTTTPAVGSSKKMKTDQLMTLKDFNIDDIDDVIELE